MKPPVAQQLRSRVTGRSEADAASPPDTDEPTKAARAWPVLVGCLVISALTLLLPATPTYDPWSWILWGREVAHFDLVTEGGPSWKPLPVVFTTVFSFLGNDLAPLAWLWISRAGGLLALAMAFRLARRLSGGGAAGIAGGVLAVAFLATTYEFIRDAALGNSEPLLAALFLWGVERHLDGRRDHALYLFVGAALLRPEVWPFLGLWGIWMFFTQPSLRLRLIAFAALILALWIGPEYWGSGEPLRASTRANDPNPGSAAFADNPGLEVVNRFLERTVIPLQLTAALAIVLGAATFVRDRSDAIGRAVVALTVLALGWIALVAAMTEGGYAGNQRYLVVTTAGLCVLAGIGSGHVFLGLRWLATRAGAPARVAPAIAIGAFVAAVVSVTAFTPVVRDKAENVRATLDELDYEASLWGTLPDAIEKAGGREAVLSCGGLFSGPFQTQMVAYELGVHGKNVGSLSTPPPGVAFRTHTVPDGPLVAKLTDDRYRQVASAGRWQVWTAPRSDAIGRTCPVAGERVPAVPETPRFESVR